MSARVILFSRQSCHLCDDARMVVDAVCASVDVEWGERDVDADPLLKVQYGDEVPVVTVDGAVVGFWHIDAERLRRALV
jgi:hypothetical protein